MILLSGITRFDWYPRMIEQVLDPLRTNRPARYQRYDWDKKSLAEWHEVAPQPHIIIEGVSATRCTFRPYLSLSIYVGTPRELRLQRGLERDGKEALALWQGWMAEEDEYLRRDDPKSNADIIVSGNPSVELIGNQVEQIS